MTNRKNEREDVTVVINNFCETFTPKKSAAGARKTM